MTTVARASDKDKNSHPAVSAYDQLTRDLVRLAHQVARTGPRKNARAEATILMTDKLTYEHPAPGVKPPLLNESKPAQALTESSSPKRLLARLEAVCASYIKLGPFEVRPGLNHEVPIGRAYQPVKESSISRLQGFIGRDQHSLYIREVPQNQEHGMRPSRNGIWIKQSSESDYRRLLPGEAARIYLDTDVRLGGNGKNGDSAYQLEIKG